MHKDLKQKRFRCRDVQEVKNINDRFTESYKGICGDNTVVTSHQVALSPKMPHAVGKMALLASMTLAHAGCLPEMPRAAWAAWAALLARKAVIQLFWLFDVVESIAVWFLQTENLLSHGRSDRDER